MDSIAITAAMSETTFAEIMSCASRKVREVLFAQMSVKAKKKGLTLKVHGKRDERVRKLHERLKVASGTRENEICQELIRTWLYTKRPMLKSALDFLKVPNEDGLVDTELDFFADLTLDQVLSLKSHLETQFLSEEVKIYLNFVNVAHLDKLGY